MSEPIKVGDLVMVVRNRLRPICGCPPKGLGSIFRVSAINRTAAECEGCNTYIPKDLCAWVDGKAFVYPLYRLKRIPPLEELQTYRQTDETTV